MTTHAFNILRTDLLPAYLAQVSKGLQAAFEALHDAEIATETFRFYTSAASVFSSKIEGADSKLDSNIIHKKFGFEFLPDYYTKPVTSTSACWGLNTRI